MLFTKTSPVKASLCGLLLRGKTFRKEPTEMQLLEIDEETEDTFFRCLHLERPADPRMLVMRRKWRKNNKSKGHRGKVLTDDHGEIVGLTNYIPIERSPFERERLMSILCMWIHGYDHLIGNQQGRGYGRYMLERIEEDARDSGYDGVTAWGMDQPRWNPVSFYEHMGYTRVARSGPHVLVWKPFCDHAVPPHLPRVEQAQVRESVTDERVHLKTASHDWCMVCCAERIMVRDSCSGLNDKVQFVEENSAYESRMSMRGGFFQVIYVDGDAVPPLPKDEFRQFLLDRYERKNR